MKLQSAVEFISTYGFMFLALGLALALVLFLASYNGTVQSTQCNSFGSVSCNFVNYYDNFSYGYGILTFSFTNSQSSPLNLTTFSVKLYNLTYTGSAALLCAPVLLYPGQETTCTARYRTSGGSGASLFTYTPFNNSLESGTYALSANLCNIGASGSLNYQCGQQYSRNSVLVNYAGTFTVYKSLNDTAPMSVIVAQLPSTTQLIANPNSLIPPNAFSSLNPLPPIIPSNYVIVQNGDWIPARNLSGFKYAYGTNSFLGQTYFGTNVVPFPSTLPALNSNSVACAPPYNALMAIAYMSLPARPVPELLTFNVFADNAIEIYYQNSLAWYPVFNGAAWTAGVPSAHGATVSVGGNSITGLAVVWENTCGDGVQAVSVNGIGQ